MTIQTTAVSNSATTVYTSTWQHALTTAINTAKFRDSN